MLNSSICILLFAEGDAPGLNEEDLQASVATLKSMADSLSAECVSLRERQEKAGTVSEYLVRVRAEEKDFIETLQFDNSNHV